MSDTGGVLVVAVTGGGSQSLQLSAELSFSAMFGWMILLVAIMSSSGFCCGWKVRTMLVGTSKPKRDHKDLAAASLRKRSAPPAGSKNHAEGDQCVQLTLLMERFTVPDLKEVCRCRDLRVGGLKGDLVRRLVEADGGLTENQAADILKLRLTLASRGLDYELSHHDVVSPESALLWLARAQARVASP